MEKLDRKQIKIEALQYLKQGVSKQETFELLVDKYKYTKDIAEILQNIPSAKAIGKYGIWNHILVAILALTAIGYFLISPSVGPILWYGLLIFGVVTKRINFYMWVTVLSSFSLLALIIIILNASSETYYWARTIVLLILFIPSCIMPIWLERKLCPKPKEKKVQYTNSQGQPGLKIIYEFSDL